MYLQTLLRSGNIRATIKELDAQSETNEVQTEIYGDTIEQTFPQVDHRRGSVINMPKIVTEYSGSRVSSSQANTSLSSILNTDKVKRKANASQTRDVGSSLKQAKPVIQRRIFVSRNKETNAIVTEPQTVSISTVPVVTVATETDSNKNIDNNKTSDTDNKRGPENIVNKAGNELSDIILEIAPLLQEFSTTPPAQSSLETVQYSNDNSHLHPDNVKDFRGDLTELGNSNDLNSDGNMMQERFESMTNDFADEIAEDDENADVHEEQENDSAKYAKILCALSNRTSQTENENYVLDDLEERHGACLKRKKTGANASSGTSKKSKLRSTYPRQHSVKDVVVCFAQVGRGAKLWTQEHPLIRGIYLNKGKREVKRHLVQMKRQPSAIDTGSYFRKGRINDKNRIDDYFEYTEVGEERRRQFEENVARDEYVVNWYMWCPGHGNCLRKCGGYGKCINGKYNNVQLVKLSVYVAVNFVNFLT